MSEQLSWSAEKLQKTEEELAMSFTSLYSAFEEAAMNETAMADAGYDDQPLDRVGVPAPPRHHRRRRGQPLASTIPA